MPHQDSALTLGIETSCDETAVAILEGARTLRANVVSSQLAEHQPFGGVVPELASRAHLENLVPILDAALQRAGVTLPQIDLVGVTSGPGLIGALLVGAGFAKGLGLALGKPVQPVHHLEAHVFANLLEHPELEPPFLALIISGGHTLLLRVDAWGVYRAVGATRDDAAGEAFDKVGKLLGLPYPAGPAVERLAREGDPSAVAFPRPMSHDRSNDFSFSGLKTAVALELRREQKSLSDQRIADLCASFQESVVDSLALKTFRAADEEPTSAVVLAGGVSRNERLRDRFKKEAAKRGSRLFFPAPELCTDNAAMVARAAYFKYIKESAGDLAFPVFARSSL